MITLKAWNTELSESDRSRVANMLFWNMSDDFIKQMSQEFHHNFKYPDGHWFKFMLSHLYKTKTGLKLVIEW